MAAYLVFTRDKTHDAAELGAYAKQVPATLAGYSVTILALNGAHEDLEGAPTEASAILEFPTMGEALAWYNSPLYAAARELRLRGASYRVTLIEGVS
jgi:uncharacterized protein (DUF1330 family)